MATDRAITKEIVTESRVSRWTVLGPLLFMVALLDMLSITQTATLTSYADGIYAVQVVKEHSDANLLQKKTIGYI